MKIVLAHCGSLQLDPAVLLKVIIMSDIWWAIMSDL